MTIALTLYLTFIDDYCVNPVSDIYITVASASIIKLCIVIVQTNETIFSGKLLNSLNSLLITIQNKLLQFWQIFSCLQCHVFILILCLQVVLMSVCCFCMFVKLL